MLNLPDLQAARKNFVDAIEKGLEDTAVSLLPKLGLLNFEISLNQDLYQPIHLAAYYGRPKIFEALMQRGGEYGVGMDVCTRSHHQSLLHILVKGLIDHKACSTYYEALFNLVLNAKPEIAFQQDKYGYTPLHNMAGSEEATPLLKIIPPHAAVEFNEQKKILDVDVTDNEGKTPLHIAALMCNFGAIKLLSDLGANVHHKDNHGQKPIDYVIQNNEQARKCRAFFQGHQLGSLFERCAKTLLEHTDLQSLESNLPENILFRVHLIDKNLAKEKASSPQSLENAISELTSTFKTTLNL